MIQKILTKKGDFGGVKTHDWHTFIKVIFIRLYIYLLVCILVLIFLSYIEINNNDLFFVTVCSTSISPKQL